MATDPTKIVPPAAAPAPAASPAPSAETPPDKGSSSPTPEPQAEAGAPASFSDPILTELMSTAGVKTFDELKTLVGNRIPDLMSKADTEKNRADEATRFATGKDEAWDQWVRGLANRGFSARQVVEALDRYKTDAKATEQSKSASRATALELVNEAFRSGDTGFAEFLQTLADDTDGKLDRQKIQRYKDTYQRLTKGAPAPATTASPTNGTAAAATATTPKEPPRLPGTSGGAATPTGPAWTGGDQSRRLLAHKK